MKFSTIKAIVTGGASGLGQAVVESVIHAGGQAVIIDCDGERGLALADSLGANAHFFLADVTDEASVDKVTAAAAETMGGLNLAVNCAGIAPSRRVLARDGLMRSAEFEQVIKINLSGSFIVCRAAANLMQHNKPEGPDGERGVIINTASIAAYEGQIGQAAYSASKGGVASMTLPLAREFARVGIRVMAIAPGLFETPMFSTLPVEAREALAADIPFPNRLGRSQEFADLVRHIVENPMLNGSVIRLDGALRMAPK
jgi:NAD(P)-dependent dehydrogenase (short-subunit alcohol dehydrogenase family)